ncbi:MAG: hypothetical protein PF495_07600 [Spirochaetales bacterium]|nr:hypothetical protein [Spirochaetales bacterium]
MANHRNSSGGYMNILHVTREAGSEIRYGIRKSLTPVLEALRSHGHTVTIFCKEDADNLPPRKLV